MAFKGLLLLFFGLASALANQSHDRLHEELLSNYNKDIAPFEEGKLIELYFDFNLIKIEEFNVKTSVLTSNVWETYKWKDYRLKWDPKDHANIKTIRLPVSLLWVPDVVLVNSLTPAKWQLENYNAVIDSTGEILWVPAKQVKTMCAAGSTYYPFDSTTCMFKYFPWSYTGKDVEMKTMHENDTEAFVLNEFTQSGSLSVHSPTMKQKCVTYQSFADEETYCDVTVSVTIARNSRLFVANTLVPCLILALFSLFAHKLSSGSYAKLALVVALTAASCVLIGRITATTADGPIPMLVQYLIALLVLNVISTLFAILGINLQSTSRLMPSFLRKIFLDTLGTLFCVDTVTYCESSAHRWELELKERDLLTQLGVVLPPADLEKMPLFTANNGDSVFKGVQLMAIKAELHKQKQHQKMEWTFMTDILDQMLFWLYLLVILVASLLTFCPLANASGQTA